MLSIVNLASRRAGLIVPLVLVMLVSLATARADLKTVAEVNVTGLPQVPPDASGTQQAPVFPQTVTTYYRADRVRIENDKGGWMLFDYPTDRIVTFDTKHKTYTVISLKRALIMAGDTSVQDGGAILPSFVTVTLDVKPSDDKKSIAARDAHRYALTGSITRLYPIARSSGGGTGGGRGRRGSGRRGNGDSDDARRGGGSRGGQSAPSVTSETTQVAAEYWLSDAMKSITVDPKYKRPLLPLFAATLAGVQPAAPLLIPLMDQIAKTGGIPLASTVTLTPTTGTPIVMASAVKSLAQGALDDSLFAIPAGYSEIKPDGASAAPSKP